MTDELIIEFEKEFEKMKAKLGFKATLEELDEVFYIRDFIKKEGYVSSRLQRMVLARIMSAFGSWEQYLHTLVVPNPNNLMNVEESKMFNEVERKGITMLLTKIRAVTSSNTGGISRDDKKDAALIDNSLLFWNNECKPKFLEIVAKVNSSWVKSASAEPAKAQKTGKKDYEFF